jgi:hypothetical protein
LTINQCEALSSNLKGKVINAPDGTDFRDEMFDADWPRIKESYWSGQEMALSPDCFVQPVNAGDVSVILQILTLTPYQNEPGCKFAIRSGG